MKSNSPYCHVVFSAMSKRNFFLREHIIKFILEKGHTPSSAFMMYSYFLLDTVDRKALIAANNELIRRSDEVWVFGQFSDGVKKEIELAKELGLPIRYFKVCQEPRCCFDEVSESDLKDESYC
jgi:hypothetical protein